MAKEFVRPEGLVKRSMFSQVVKAGNTIYVAGQTSRDQNGTVLGIGSFEAQAEKVFSNLKTALAASGASLNDVVETICYLTDMDNAPALAAITEKYFGTKSPPASTWVEVTSLASPDMLLEIKAIAVKD